MVVVRAAGARLTLDGWNLEPKYPTSTSTITEPATGSPQRSRLQLGVYLGPTQHLVLPTCRY